ncbi:hypothetical protein TIFTF001_006456, partial [Ficus carica]
MAFVVGSRVKLFTILFLCLITFSSFAQGKKDSRSSSSSSSSTYEFRYPFIKRASSFSSESSSFASKGNDNGFDYIIVGGGTTGCPLAATLSQKFSVLVLERGGVPFSNANVSFFQNFHIALADTSPSSASQAFV